MQYDPSAMQNHPSAHVGFSKIYEGNPPWDIGKPQPPFVTVADQIVSPVLDAGCGTGNTALFYAALGIRSQASILSKKRSGGPAPRPPSVA